MNTIAISELDDVNGAEHTTQQWHQQRRDEKKKGAADTNAVDIEMVRSSHGDVEGNKGTEGEAKVDNVSSVACPNKVQPFKALSWLDRFLVVWILLAMAIGILIGNLAPDAGDQLKQSDFIGVSVPIAVGLLVMMYPILCRTKFETLPMLLSHRALWKQLLTSVILNWLVAPFLMLGLAWAFLPDKRDLREGLIIVGIARCIAMVLVWTDLAGGDTQYCAFLVAVNSLLQMALFAPLATLFIVTLSDQDAGSLDLQYGIVARSVAVFLGIPLAAALLTRLVLRRFMSEETYTRRFARVIAPFSLLALLYTIIVLFASQGAHVVAQITSVLRVVAPLVVYFALSFTGAVALCRWRGWGYGVSCAQSFTAASNNFELAIAVAVAVFGVDSDQALAAVVGPLVEVPVLVGCVYAIKFWQRRWKWDG